MYGEANLTLPYKGQTQRRTIIFTILDFPSQIICAKIRSQGLLGSGEKDL